MMGECIQVSHEMIALVGAGDARGAEWPADPIMLGFQLGTQPVLRVRTKAGKRDDDAIFLIVAREACLRLFANVPEDGDYHLPTELRAIAHAIVECASPATICTTYRLGKSIELLCESFRLLGEDALVPARADGVLSLVDARRLIEARRLIDERWNEKLTIDRIARACGLNRVKLNRGFRQMFDCTVAVALAERRLEQASRMLRTTDRPISSIGYDNGYLNNASFARAFARRFGVSPSDYRSARLAA